MTAEMTADALFTGGSHAPRGTYLCLSTGVVHRVSKPTPLPEGGPFRLVAPTCSLAIAEPPVRESQQAAREALAPAPARHTLRWPEDNDWHYEADPGAGWWQIMLLSRLGRMGSWF